MSAVAIMAVAAAGAFADADMSERERTMVVCVKEGNAGSAAHPAEAVASRVFAQIGVRIEWHWRGDCPSAPSMVQISFSEQTERTLKKEAFAYALPYEGTHIVIFSDRVAQAAKNKLVPQLLAYVLVHEITHVLRKHKPALGRGSHESPLG